ncbi:hypothetical protein [Streptomyces albipurpureus]|uniref:Uncharacterized protein n=1 Tax=Streptomyces albipurpureus TaxID=2897419 RepID=A0ABT0UNR4_9ACTN|nr:hypothetical protein [Streptomyces sp. CWNU-1]MCM2390168.1 hypothetical protein [Streptomyces sp. CWNU-1]
MPSAHDITTCPRCGDPVRKTITAKNALELLVNPDPDPTGNTAVYTDRVGRVKSRGLTTERPTPEGSEWLAIPHIATCTNPPAKRSNKGTPSRAQPRPRPRPQIQHPYWKAR